MRRILRYLTYSLLANCAAFSQTPQSQDANAERVKVSGNLRTRFEGWDWFEGQADNIYGYSGSLLRVGISQEKKTFDWQIEMAAPILLGLPENAVASGPQGQMGLGAAYYVGNDRSRNTAMIFPKQGYIRFRNLGESKAHSIRLGRMEFIEGTETTPKNGTVAALKRDRIAHRLIGNFGWTHVGRSFDGAHYVYNTAGTNVTVLGARATRGVFQVDGWGELDVSVFYGAVTRPIATKKSAGEWRAFAIQYRDSRNVLKTDNRPMDVRNPDREPINMTTLGGHYIHNFETSGGQIDVLFWGVGQFGTWGSQDHKAGALAAEAGYQPPILGKLKPWIRGGYFYGSGDDDPSDDKHNTFFEILPTPRWYARFPFFNLMNNDDIFGQFMLQPHQKLSLRAEVHSLRLASRNDLWYLGGGAFQPWTFGYIGRPSSGGRGLATLFDVSADCNVGAGFSLSGYYGVARGKSVVAGVYPEGRNGHLGYLELTYRF